MTMMRDAVKDWMVETLDCGLMPEAEMHRLAAGMPPREYALIHQDSFVNWAAVAFDAMDKENGLTVAELVQLSIDTDSVIRFWAVRGLAIRGSDHPKTQQALQKATGDESPSVAIAACDGLLSSSDRAVRKQATDRLIELANVEKVGHFAAIAAMNALDMNAELDAETKAQLSKMPREVRKPPARVGKYVGKLIDHAIKSK